MRAAAEILVDSSLRVVSDDDTLQMRNALMSFEVKIRNNPDAGPFAQSSLRVEMFFETESLQAARSDALDNMAIVLNALCLTTGARFQNVTVVRVFDWTPEIDERDGRYFGSSRVAIASPELDRDFALTAERMMAMHHSDVSQAVMRWYRFGQRADNIEDQFMYFWFAVEIASGALKEAGKIAHLCPKCNSELYCKSCDEIPMRRRFETEAIKDLIFNVAPPDIDKNEIYKTLTKIRNTLQHGRRLHSIADKLPCTDEQAVHALANIAWRAISLLADYDRDPNPDTPLTLARIEDVANKIMVTSAHIVSEFPGGGDLDLAGAPNVDISLVIDGKSYSFDGRLLEG